MMIEEDFCLHKLVLRDIRPTAIRVLVLRTLLEMKQAMSVSDLEAQLDTVDKSTIFRTLTLFLSHHLIHGVDDGSGTLKYAVCVVNARSKISICISAANVAIKLLCEKYTYSLGTITSRFYPNRCQLCD